MVNPRDIAGNTEGEENMHSFFIVTLTEREEDNYDCFLSLSLSLWRHLHKTVLEDENE